ncbi:hypothetical protein CERSUDRAFT_95690 [Gelatoporia subvermispora B]|uniref:Uncharacterized protein n=1 Tax=Ceriporiopsis subvermispora (strain B) TaxID=914234 RepID=M2RC59_CERS8|nr:hypothetical protein CERSUDRAFT_95690 [Gelatoporia subvermispora B]
MHDETQPGVLVQPRQLLVRDEEDPLAARVSCAASCGRTTYSLSQLSEKPLLRCADITQTSVGRRRRHQGSSRRPLAPPSLASAQLPCSLDSIPAAPPCGFVDTPVWPSLVLPGPSPSLLPPVHLFRTISGSPMLSAPSPTLFSPPSTLNAPAHTADTLRRPRTPSSRSPSATNDYDTAPTCSTTHQRRVQPLILSIISG